MLAGASSCVRFLTYQPTYQPTYLPTYHDQGEIAYMWLLLFAKGVLGLLVLSNVLMLGSFTEIYES